MTRNTIIATLLALMLAPPAVAQEDGVFVDPDSPAGKEYAIPLEEARRQASGGQDGGSGGPAGQPLFGAGIERAEDGVAGGNGRGETEGGTAKGGTGSQGDSPDASDVVPNARSSAAIEAAASGGSDTLLTAGIVAALLAAGLLAGVALRRALRNQ